MHWMHTFACVADALAVSLCNWTVEISWNQIPWCIKYYIACHIQDSIVKCYRILFITFLVHVRSHFLYYNCVNWFLFSYKFNVIILTFVIIILQKKQVRQRYSGFSFCQLDYGTYSVSEPLQGSSSVSDSLTCLLLSSICFTIVSVNTSCAEIHLKCKLYWTCYFSQRDIV